MTDHDEQLRELLAKASQQTDSRKLDKLTAEINELLEKESAEPTMDEPRVHDEVVFGGNREPSEAN